MTDLDEKWHPPTREQLMGDSRGVSLGDNPDRGAYVVFRAVCGSGGYYCSARFRDPEGFGGGATKREALRSLAENLRLLAARVERAARR